MAPKELIPSSKLQFWAQFLHENGLAKLAAAFLENGGFLRPLMGQVISAGSTWSADPDKWLELAEILADRDSATELALALKRAPPDQ
ncbi:MAG TPA: hypothetical protein PKD55_02075 [Bellilinea sp.]|nr:hypothetical protein [Bellilinea sp.]